ncbi:uncharacterized protein LOC144354689, partial [Saccoglossus kowalevskii]
SDYIGCFRDKSARALEFQADLGSDMTIDLCINACGPHGNYAGVQYSSQCFCGDDYDEYGALDESSCNMKCTGDSSEICGGTWANAVYKSREPTYIGCYVDTSSRALSGYSYSDGSNMTPKACINACIANNDGHKVFYAGVQYASQCFCGTDFSKYDSADEADCSAACTGDTLRKQQYYCLDSSLYTALHSYSATKQMRLLEPVLVLCRSLLDKTIYSYTINIPMFI